MPGPRPKPHHLRSWIAVTSLNAASPIPAGDHGIIPARFRFFGNYDLWNPGVEVKEVQPDLLRAPIENRKQGDYGEVVVTSSFSPALPALQSVSWNRSRYTIPFPVKTRQGKTKRNR